jgi:5-deoxy-glucuronate isomerase
MSDTARLVVRGRAVDPAAGGTVVRVVPGSPGWAYAGLEVVVVPAGGRHDVACDGVETLVLPLAGGCRVDVTATSGGPDSVVLAGRASVFDGPTDSVYLPLGTAATIRAPEGGPARVAVATAPASRARPVRPIGAGEAVVELRGAGPASRRVVNYTLGTGVPVDHLLVCEVVTPGGNVSSYPPHKHDEHSDAERELEEVYYFEVAAGPAGPGVAYHRTYGTPARPIDVLAEVRTGDAALVPHGYHGPTIALPGYDLYYLNVMAGPATDGRWLMVDDPAYHWVRESWAGRPIDPRLLPEPPTIASSEASA